MLDIFSRYAWSVTLKDKTGTSIKAALKYLFRNRKPFYLQSYKGTECVNSTVRQYLQGQDVNFYTTNNPDIKGAIPERFNRTLKTKLYKYFTKNNTYHYSDVIDKLVTSYTILFISRKVFNLVS